MRGAPPLVETLLNELWYAATLVLQGDRTTAAHHAEEAREKAERVHDLLAAMRRAETRSHCASLRLRSEILQRKARELIQRSEVLLSRSYGIKERSTRDRQPLRC